jgi:uncharacterized membrane protein
VLGDGIINYTYSWKQNNHMNLLENLRSYDPDRNVSTPERVISGIAGAWMLRSAFANGGLLKGAAGAYLLYRAVSGHCPVANALTRDPELHARNINVRTHVTVDKPRNEVYAFWRKLEQLPLFMDHLVSVEQAEDGQSRWTAKLPGVPEPVQWYASIILDEPGELLSWAALPGSQIDNAGKVEFRDAGPGRTEIRATITYRAPLGLVGEGAARLLNPLLEGIVEGDLLNFKQYIESNKMMPVD